MDLLEVAATLYDLKENIILIYGFNAVGKTRLSTTYKDLTKDTETDQHTGVYYNAFSEDLFVWDNDVENRDTIFELKLTPSSLNKFHGLLTEEAIEQKLKPYNPKYRFLFNQYTDPEKGIESIRFYNKGYDEVIKISRGEERIFVWCFFLAMFDIESWTDQQNEYIFIDDPISSLDDHNIYITASTLFDLVEKHYKKSKIIITTHHIGFASIINDWLLRGIKADKFKKETKQFILEQNEKNELRLENPKECILLYHLHLLQILHEAITKDQLYNYHFALLRQVLENIASFLGVGQFSYVLEQIGITDPDKRSKIVNDLSHKKVYYYQPSLMVQDNKDMFLEIFNGLKEKYKFVLHAELP